MGFLRELTDTELDAISGGAVSLFGGGSTGANFAVGVSSGAAGTSAGSTGIPNTLFGAFVQFNGPGAGVGITQHDQCSQRFEAVSGGATTATAAGPTAAASGSSERQMAASFLEADSAFPTNDVIASSVSEVASLQQRVVSPRPYFYLTGTAAARP